MKKPVTIVAAVLSIILATSVEAAIQLGPTPYLSFADSPFKGTSFTYFHLEDFEDGALNTPGVSADKGSGYAYYNMYADSVDADDGVIDGSGTYGHSWALYNDVTDSVNFVFDKGVLGSLPTHAGLVWTDVHPGYGNVSFTAYDAKGVSLGTTLAYLGDGTTLGGTAEDRFFGVVNSGGVSTISMSTTHGMTWEVDHLQYGAAPVPEPDNVILFSAGLACLAALRLRNRRRLPGRLD